MVESTNKKLNNRQMAMEKHGDDLLGFRIVEVTSGECTVNDFREVKPVSFSLEGSNTKILPFEVKGTRPEPLNFDRTGMTEK